MLAQVRKIVSFVFVCVTALALVACQTVPYDAHKKIEATGNFYTRQVTQDGKLVSRFEAMNSLKMNPQTAELATKSANWYYAALGASAVGAFLVGYNLAQGNGMTGVLLGAALVGGGAGAAYMSDAPLLEALQIHNSGANRKKRGALDFQLNFNLARIESLNKQEAVPFLGLHSEF